MNIDEINKKDEINNESLQISSSELRRIKENIARTDTEKFHLFTRMMRIHFMLKKAVIVKK